MAGFSPIAGPGLPGNILKKKKEEEEQNVTQKYSPVAAPGTSLKNTEKKITNKNGSGSEKKSGSATGGGKAAGRSPAVFGAYSPVVGVPDPLERLRNRISGGTKEAADIYRGGAARRRTNVPAAGKTVDPVTADYLSRVSPVTRTLEKHGLSSGSDFDRILSMNRVAVRQDREQAIQALLDRGKAQNGNKHFLRNGYEGTVRERLAQEKEKEQKVARRYDRMLQREVEKKYGLDPYTSTLSDIQEVIWKNEKSINSAKTQADAEALAKDNQILGGMLGKDSIYRETERGKQLVQFEALDEQPDFFSRQSVNKKERDRVYRVINNVDGFGDYVKAYEEGGAVPQVSSGKTFSYVDTDDRKYLFMTALEKSRYNYLYNTEGKRAAKEYLNLLEPDLNKRQTEDKVKSAAAFAQKHPVAASVISLAEAPARGIGGVISTVGDVGGVLSGKEIDPYSKYKQLAHTAQAVRETVSSSLDKDWQRFLYNAGMSIGDNVIEMGVMSLLTVGAAPALKAIDNAADLSKAVSALNKITKYGVSSMVFGDVAASAVIDGKAKGYSDEKALGLGLVSALIEGATEKWSLDVLLKKPKTLFTSVLRGMAAEGSEEGLSAAANMAVDGLVNGSDADIAKRIEELKQDGYSDMGALTLALTEGILPDMVAGALGGGLMGGMHYSVSKLFGGKQQKTKSGKNGVTFDDIIYIGNEGTNKNAKNGADNDLLLSIGQNGQKKKRYGSLLAPENRARFSKEVDGVFDGGFPQRSALVLGDTPPLLQKYGAGDVPLTVSVSAVFKMAYPTGYLGLKHGHNLGIPAVKHLPEQISSPLAILRSNSVDGSLVLLTEWADRNDNRVVVPVHLNKNGQMNIGGRINTENRVTSAYGKKDFSTLLFDENGNSTVLYTKGNESIDSLLASSGLQLPGVGAMASSGLQLPGAPSEDTLIDYSISRKNENYNPDLQKNSSNSQTGKTGDAFDDIVNIGKEGTNKNAKNSADNDLLFSINYDKNNVPFVEVDNDVLAGLTQKEKQAKVKEILKDRFSQGVSAGNELVKVNQQSRKEILNSKYSQRQQKRNPSVYQDKLNAVTQLDEIVQASRDYVGEEKKHPRKDNIREFARGTVNLRVGGKDYSADVIVGTTNQNELVFYDLINLAETSIESKIKKEHSIAVMDSNEPSAPLDGSALSNSSIPQTTGKNNPNLQENGSNSQTGENGSAPSFLIDTQENQTQGAEAAQEKQKVSLNAFRRVVEALGYRVIDAPRAERVEQDVDLNDVDGYVDYGLGEVYINPNAKNPLDVVMKHELTHVLENVSGKYVGRVQSFFETHLSEQWSETQEAVIEKYNKLGKTLDEHQLTSETLAELSSYLATDEAVNRFGTDERFCRNISLWFSYMAKKIKSVFGDLTVADKLEVAAYKWEKALRQAEKRQAPQGETSVNNFFMQNEENDTTLDFLLAGEKAKTHDPAALDKAKRLSAFGETPRQIWKETGWVKGQEGKWRFELDDSKMKFRKKDGKICDVLRISELNFQSMTEGLSDAESDEFWLLRQAASRGELSAPLSDVISYDLLFEAYPALKDVLVKSDYHAVGMGKAAYDPGTKTIYLSPQANGTKLRQTLLHEIQHAVQDEEGFASGSSPDYWMERSGISAQEAERLYENTAGEIEARDVESRADLTEEERRNTFPESAEPNDDVVFVEEEYRPGEVYRFSGKRMDGIEVYETSDEVKALPYRERKQKFLERMKEEFRGRTVKFVRNGQTYYAAFEEKDVRKNIYGDKKSDSIGLDSKVNIGADGNIFELVENADYRKNKAESGKNIRAHQGVTDWDYFAKTVQIDGTVFDVLINVRKKNSGEFVYDIQLNENKNIRALPPSQHTLNQGGVKKSGALRSDNDSLSQVNDSVNSYSMQTQENNAPERTISQLADELEEIDRLLDNEDLSDEEYRRLDRKTRKLEREISILTARRAAQTARTAGNSGVPFSGRNLLEDSGQQGAADSSIELSQDFGDYPYDMQNVLKGYFNGVDKRILDFVNQHKKGNFERLNLDPVSDRLKEDIRELTGQNLDGYIFAMNSNAVEHIQQRHGKFGAADHSMAHSDDIARALYVLNYYDDVRLLRDANGSPVFSQEFKNADGLPANMVLFSKKINGTYYAAVAVPESKYKKMWLVTAYINKKGVTQVPNDELSSLRSTSETELASPPNDSVSQGETSVNSYSMQTQENNAFDRILRMSGGNKEKRITFDDLVGRNF